MRVANLARIPDQERAQFYDLLSGTVQWVWDWDRRASSFRPGNALLEAADAARTLHSRLRALNAADRAWLEKLVRKTTPNRRTREESIKYEGRTIELPWHDGGLAGLQETVGKIAQLFGIAVGRSSPSSPRKKGAKRPRSLKDPTFQYFVRNLLIDADQAGGTLSFEKNIGKGTLVDAIKLLTPQLPAGVIPARLPMSTLQRIKTSYRDLYVQIDQIEASLPD